EHQDKNFSIWLPMFDVAFGSYYHPKIDEYPPTGLQSGETFETVWHAQTAPFVAWARGIRTGSLEGNPEPTAQRSEA
ncbi:MAG: hypothetical protein HKN19_12390, partial [Halioglobus sp.]|nr:hypothetical protein [Halioglobus sp.]